jgi:DNA-binding CsgD family transcriptional regulator
VTRITNADLRSVIEMLHDLSADRSGEIFPRTVIERLGELLDAPNAGYSEWRPREPEYYIRTFPFGEMPDYYIRTLPEPDWFGEALLRWHHQDAINCTRFRTVPEPIAVSDVLSKRAVDGAELYQYTLRAFGFADMTKLFLPPGVAGEPRFFFFDRERWGLASRERALLDLLRSHLTLHREKWRPPPPGLQSLTSREREILEAVSNGETNAQIAKRLWISPYTVRAHLEHIFEKLNVKTRTEAAAQLFAARA